MYVLVIYCLIGILGFLKRYVSDEKFKKFSIIVFILTMIFFSIRLDMGSDIPTYMIVYDRVENPIYDAIQYHLSRNLGFTSLALLCKKIFGSYRMFLLVCNILTAIVIAYIVLKYSKNILISLMIFIGSGYLEVYYSSGIRQSLAMAVFLFSYFEFLENKKYLKYYIGIVIACMFHDVSIVGFVLPIILYLLNKIKENKITKGLMLVVVTGALSFISSYLLTKLVWTYGANSSWNHLLYYFYGQSFSIAGLGLQIVITLMCIFLYYIGTEKNAKTYMQVQMVFISLLIYILLVRYPVVSRVCDFIQVILIVTIPNILDNISSKKKYVLSFVFVFILNGYLLYTDIKEKVRKLDDVTISSYPYISLFDEEKCELYFYGDE